MPQGVVDIYYVIMLNIVHTVTLHACLQVVNVHGVNMKGYSDMQLCLRLCVLDMYL